MPATISRKHARQTRNDVRFLSRPELEKYFDRQAWKLVNLSGEEALRRIRNGQVGDDLNWTSLTLLATLFPR